MTRSELTIAPDEAALRCRRCGYNLREHDRRSRCPECATPVAWSAGEPFLHRRDPEWFNAVRLGLIVRCCAPAAGALYAAASLVTLVLSDRWPTSFMLCGGFVIAAASIFGVHRMTRPDPGFESAESEQLQRALCRILTVVGALALPVVAARIVLTLSPAASSLLDWAAVALGLAWLAALMLQSHLVGPLSDVESEGVRLTPGALVSFTALLLGTPTALCAGLLVVVHDERLALRTGVAVIALELVSIVVATSFGTICFVCGRFLEAHRRRTAGRPKTPAGQR